MLSILIALAQDISVNRTLVADGVPYMFTPPEYVASLENPQFHWSPDGKTLVLVGREPVRRPATVIKALKGEPVSQMRLVLVWNKATGRIREVLRMPPPTEVDVTFAGPSNAPYVLTQLLGEEGYMSSVWRVVDDNRAQRVLGPKPDLVGLTGSPTRTLCMVIDASTSQAYVPYLISGDRAAQLPPLPTNHFPSTEWDVTGTKLRLHIPRPAQTQRVPYFDVVNESVGDVTGWTPWSPKPVPYKLDLIPMLQASAKDKEGKERRAQISKTNAEVFEASANGFSIAFLSEGSIYAVSAEPLDPKVYEEMLGRAEQLEAMMEAKQTMLAVLMLANDNDDRIGAATEIGSQLGPYLKNASIMSRFSFTYEGTLDFTKIEEPAKFIVGQVQTSRGSAVAYADGHVKWIRKG